ncbi:glycogen debranching protein GlgX [Cellulomonas sp. NPDC089187]|uniref:glycogen debranching protein GlgX n=1 Tax=Cellulomonas sp. NPDC089187 TaxID=3154970 RepID=UPI00341B54D1
MLDAHHDLHPPNVTRPCARQNGPVSAPTPTRLGVHPIDDGIEVAVLAPHADAIDLCLLDPAPEGGWTERRIRLDGPELGIFHAQVPGVRVGQHYGLRAHGAWDPANGLRYNPAKLLVDPYAVGLSGELGYGPQTYGHRVEDGDPYGPADDRDSLGHVPHGVVLDLTPDPASDPTRNRPQVPWADTLVYEAHVRGLTARHPEIPAEERGTYAALGHPALIQHLHRLGVTALELLPIHACAPEPHLVERGLTNYWGYNTLGFFAPDPRWASAAARAAGPAAVLAELRTAVHRLHEAGIEVLLDVVYNHTSEGGLGGQHLSLRGLDSAVYYLHDGGHPAALADVTGCGNSLDFRRPEVVRLALDSLRHWVQQLGVDGFRFDLAVTLGRGHMGFDPDHPFLVATATDPVLQGIKLIAEPWDLGPGGWRTGQFPSPWSEWNDRFRNSARSFWLADPARATHGDDGHRVRDLATRLSGSVDLFGHSDPPLLRGTRAAVNYVTAHDGFTLADLVAYEHKHNEANGEDNRDGTDDNRSWNHGVEGPVEATAVAADLLPIRRRSIRNLLGTLLLSAGTPMLTAGDEMGRTQHGNNNAYCQDGELSWLPWKLSPWRQDLLATTRHLSALRRAHPALRGQRFYTGRPIDGAELPDLSWFDPQGEPFTHARWHDGDLRTLQMLRVEGEDRALLVLNGSLEPQTLTLAPGADWQLVWDSVWEHPDETTPGDEVMEPLSLRLYVG